MQTYKFKLYNCKRSNHLKRKIRIAANIYNHCIALHKRYYRLYGKSLNAFALMKHITKLKKLPRHSFWNDLGSQAVQDIVTRIDKGYKLFFRNQKIGIKSAPPSFKKAAKYKSFTLKQAGYKLFEDNKIKIADRIYKFHKSREVQGNIKTVTIKRDILGDIYIYIVTDKVSANVVPRTGKSVGYDFGLKTFLKASDGNDIFAPEFFKLAQNEIKRLNRSLSKKKKGSNNRRRARTNLARAHKRIYNRRLDFQFKLAKYLANNYDEICIEDLNIKAMQRLWGKKISDLSHSSFVNILKYQCSKTGTRVIEIPRFFPSSKTCSACGFVMPKLPLSFREWTCDACNTTHDRDLNAAINIHRVGTSTLGVETVRPTLVG